MLVSTRLTIAVVLLASACTDGGPAVGDDNDDGDNVGLQCTTPQTCPAPTSATKQTLCGQLYDLGSNERFGGPAGTACTQVTSTGPCSLAIEAYDAVAFGQNPVATSPLPHGDVVVDACGRYRVEDIDVTGISPFIALSIDDASGAGTSGTTVPTAIATPKLAGMATADLDAWIVNEATTTEWTTSGGPDIGTGVFVPVFLAHSLGLEPQSGVTFTRAGNPLEAAYFAADLMERTTVDTAAVATGVNGTALVVGATINDSVVFAGTGGLADSAHCRWMPHAAMTLPSRVFVQTFRPVSVPNETCPL